MTKRNNLRREIEGRTFTRNRAEAGGDLVALLDAGRRAVARGAGREREDGTFVTDANRSPLAGVNGALSLRAMLPELLDSAGRVYRTPLATPAQEQRTLAAAVMENSRVVRAGAKLIEIAEPEFQGANPEPMLADVPTRFSVIEPAPFGAVALSATTDPVVTDTGFSGDADEGTLAASVLPVSTAEIDRGALTQRAVRFEIGRSVLRQHNDGEIAAEIMQAIALGLGRAVDAELLGAINAATPAAYTVAAAAAASVRFEELRAIVGTTGTGAAADLGNLFVSGVPAEITADMAETLIGAWDRFAVTIEPEISILMERTRAGALVATCWADFGALVPDAGFAWAVA